VQLPSGNPRVTRLPPELIQRYERGAFSYKPGEPLQDYMLSSIMTRAGP